MYVILSNLLLTTNNDISFYDETRVVKRMLATKEKKKRKSTKKEIYKIKEGKIEILFKKEGEYTHIISVTEDLEEESKFRIDSNMVA